MTPARHRPVRLVFTPHGWEDYTYWLAADRSTLKRINRLIDDALRDPVAGIGNLSHFVICSPVRGLDGSATSTVWCISSTATTS